MCLCLCVFPFAFFDLACEADILVYKSSSVHRWSINSVQFNKHLKWPTCPPPVRSVNENELRNKTSGMGALF